MDTSLLSLFMVPIVAIHAFAFMIAMFLYVEQEETSAQGGQYIYSHLDSLTKHPE